MDKTNIYKYSLFQELVARGHRFLRTKPNERNDKYVIYVFKQSEELESDIAEITGHAFKSERGEPNEKN